MLLREFIRGFNPIMEISEIWKNRMALGIPRCRSLETNQEKQEITPSLPLNGGGCISIIQAQLFRIYFFVLYINAVHDLEQCLNSHPSPAPCGFRHIVDSR